MPMYEYRCSACGCQKEFLQKYSDPPMTDCPACGKPTLAKMLTAAGFQLKGSGWYATDFKNGGSKSKPAAGETKTEGKTEGGGDTKTETKSEAAPVCGAGACSACS